MRRNGQQSIFRQYLLEEITSREHPGGMSPLTERVWRLIRYQSRKKNGADLSAAAPLSPGGEEKPEVESWKTDRRDGGGGRGAVCCTGVGVSTRG